MKMKEEQFRLIQAQIKRLMGQGGFYSKKFAGIDPDSIQSQEDFEKLPFTWKGDLRDAYPLGLQAVPDEQVVRIHSSSGTTGTPVIIPYTKKDVSDWAFMFKRCYEMAGVTARPHPYYAWLWIVDSRYWVSSRRGAVGGDGGSDGAGQY